MLARWIERSLLVILILILAWQNRSLFSPAPSPPTLQTFQIKDVLHAVRAQLIEAEQERINRGLMPLFQVQSLDLELQAIVEEDNKTKGSAEIKIVGAGFERSSRQQHTTKITLHLQTVPLNITPRKLPTVTPRKVPTVSPRTGPVKPVEGKTPPPGAYPADEKKTLEEIWPTLPEDLKKELLEQLKKSTKPPQPNTTTKPGKAP